MLSFGINHMTVPRISARALLDMATATGCAGVELRTDLDVPLFDGLSAQDFGALTHAKGLQIYALAELTAFNIDTADKRDAATDLIATAAHCGAQGVALIPQVATAPIARDQQRALLRQALGHLQPILDAHDVQGYIEPLGFAQSSLRHKEDVVRVLDDLNRPACFRMIHDTFHHHLAGDTAIYPDLTALLHVSGVADAAVETAAMTDAHRGLVFADDRLGNIAQLYDFAQAGFAGPASFEAFTPEIHEMTDPTAAVAGSIAFITSHLAAPAVGAA